jgi:hypothetical protein
MEWVRPHFPRATTRHRPLADLQYRCAISLVNLPRQDVIAKDIAEGYSKSAIGDGGLLIEESTTERPSSKHGLLQNRPGLVIGISLEPATQSKV